ncbi:MAG: DUF4012 domain-containing protein [Candidatus Komeilibacteria bacterium]
MPKLKKGAKATTTSPLGDLLDRIDDFLYDPQEPGYLLNQSNLNNRLQAKRKIGRLIAQDAADQKQQPGARMPAINTQPSPHVTDLRDRTRQRRIAAIGFDHFERPKSKPWSWQPFKRKPRTPAVSNKTTSVPKIDWLKQSTPSQPIPTAKVFTANNFNPWAAVLAFALIALAIILPIKSLVFGSKLVDSRSAIMAQGELALNHLQQGISSITAADFLQAEVSFESANADFQGMREEINSYNQTFVHIVEQLPTIGPEMSFSKQLLTVAQNISQAAAILAATGSQDLSPTQSIAETRERFANVRQAVIEADKNLASVSISATPESIRSAIASFKSQAPTIINDLARGDKVMAVAYSLLGGDHLSRQLIVFQNNRELRATGGFLGSYAVADFNAGALTKFSLPGGGTYDTAGGLKYRLVPPYALQLISPSWNLWDANWWPDWPISAQKISWFYQKSGGTTVDGVIAINATTVADLLAVVGPINLPQYSLIIDKDNFFDQLQQEIQLNYDKTANKPKQILSDLAPLLLEKIMNHPDKLKIAQVLLNSLASRNIQLYSQRPEIQQAIDDLGWAGRQLKTDGDYLQVISTNVAGGKSDGYIAETVNHRAVIMSDGSIEVTTTINKINNAPSSDVLGYLNNVDYLRIYVPAGSVLLAAGGFQPPASNLFKTGVEGATVDDYLKSISGEITIDDQSGTRINQENGKTVFGNWLQVKPGATISAFFKYRLPQRISISNSTGSLFINYWSPHYREVDSYSFLTQPQSGNDHTTIEHSLIVDPAYKIIWNNSLAGTELSATANKIQFSQPLSTIAYYSLLLAGQ